MSEKASARPPQVTMAGWVSIVGSVFVVVTAFEFMANLRSIETREQVSSWLEDPPLEGSGLGLQGVLDLLHGMALVLAACAAATAILGWYVMRRHAQARIVLTVLAVPIFLVGAFIDGFLSSIVAVAAFLLWTRPSRDWFQGRPWQPTLTGTRPPPESSPPTDDAPSGEPPPPAAPSGQGEQPSAYPGYGTQLATEPAPRPAARPGELLQACILTWVFAGVTLVSCAMLVLLVAVDPGLVDEMMATDDRYADMGLDQESVRTGVLVVGSLFSVWSVVAILLAVLAFGGREWARRALLVSAVLALVVSLASAISSPVALVMTVACGLAALQLTRPAVRRWTRGR